MDGGARPWAVAVLVYDSKLLSFLMSITIYRELLRQAA